MNVSMTPLEIIQIVISIFGLIATLIATIIAVSQYIAKRRSGRGKANQERKGAKKKHFNASVKSGRFSADVSWASEDKKEEG